MRRNFEHNPHILHKPEGDVRYSSNWLSFGHHLLAEALERHFPNTMSGLGLRREVILNRVTLTIPNLPSALKGFKILVVSDMHSDGHKGHLDRVLKAVDQIEDTVHVVTMLGDFTKSRDPTMALKVAEQVVTIAYRINPDYRTLAILGNHDSEAIVDPLLDLSESLQTQDERSCQSLNIGSSGIFTFHLLVNESHVIEHQGQKIRFNGTDDPFRYFTPAALDVLKPVAADEFGIALVHAPDLADQAAAAGHGLYLCGHTHGGHFCRPNGRPLLNPLGYARDLLRGAWRRGDMTGFTTTGVTWGLGRLFCPGEIALLTLT
jgi:predicted MPP superfamily phosphohydrolase